METAVRPAHIRSLYRQFLRELPARSPSILANPSPIQKHIRADFAVPFSSSPLDAASQTDGELATSLQHASSKSVTQRVAEAEQFMQYMRSQRMYISLLERYNPGMNMSEEDRTRLTARRVGMDLPIEHLKGGSGGGDTGRGA